MNLSTFLAPYIARQAEQHAQSAEDAAFDLIDQVLDGDDDARQVALLSLRDSFTRQIKVGRQAGHVTTLVAGNRRAPVKTMPSQPLVSAESGEQLGWSLTDLWDMDADGLQELLRRQLKERQQVSDRIAVTRSLIAALAAHPECATARCAWLADGRSFTEIDLSA